MQLITTSAHQGEGAFLTFEQGTDIKLISACERYLNWYQAEIQGHLTYVPTHFIEQGKLVCDYNPTELVVRENEIVELLALHYEWALVKRENEIGWLPCRILKSK